MNNNFHQCKYCLTITTLDQIESEMIKLCRCKSFIHKNCIIEILQFDPDPFCLVCSEPYEIDIWVKIDLFFYQLRHFFD